MSETGVPAIRPPTESDVAREPRVDSAHPLAAWTAGGPRVLVVDDEPGPREALTRLLRTARCEVEVAVDGDEAIERVTREPAPEIVVLDAHMPRMTGIDALREIRRLRPAIEVVMLTGFGSRETARLAREYGARSYLTKPFQTGELLRAIADAVRAVRGDAAAEALDLPVMTHQAMRAVDPLTGVTRDFASAPLVDDGARGASSLAAAVAAATPLAAATSPRAGALAAPVRVGEAATSGGADADALRTDPTLSVLPAGVQLARREVLPTPVPLAGHLSELVEALKRTHTLGVLFLDFAPLRVIEERYGFEVYDTLLEAFHARAAQAADDLFPGAAVGALTGQHDDGFVIFLHSNAAGGPVAPATVEAAVDRLRMHLLPRMMSLCLPYHNERVEFGVGHACVIYRPLIRPERLIYRGLEDARASSRRSGAAVDVERHAEIMHILLERKVSSIYQPIVDMKSKDIRGYEALCRGPRESDFESPVRLFEACRQARLSPDLDRVCRLRALSGARGLPAGRKLFVNVLPTTIGDPDFRGAEEVAYIAQQGLQPSDVVLELTESLPMGNVERFLRNVAVLRERGFGIAIDDAGTGYSNLTTISEVRPDYLKIDMSLVRGVDYHPLRRAVVETFKQLADRIGAIVITEGIETRGEYETLRAMDIQLGQGYYFAPPSAHLVERVE